MSYEISPLTFFSCFCFFIWHVHFFHGRLHNKSTIPSYVSIIMAFVKLKIIIYTSIPYLSISFISSTIYYVQNCCKKKKTQEINLIPGRKGSCLKWRSLRLFFVMYWLIIVFYFAIGILWTTCMTLSSFFKLCWYFETIFFLNVFMLVVMPNTCLVIGRYLLIEDVL